MTRRPLLLTLLTPRTGTRSELESAPFGKIFDTVRVREHRADRDHQDLLKVMPGPVACLAWIFNLIQTFHQTRSDSAHIADSKDESRRHISAVYKPTAQAVERQRLGGRGEAEEMSFECDGPGNTPQAKRCFIGLPTFASHNSEILSASAAALR